MNVLIFVMTMLMLLSLMTYARLDTYRSSRAFQTIFEDYMEKDERGYINSRAKVVYDDVKIKEKKKDDKPTPKINASPRIGLKLFIDDKRKDEDDKWPQTVVLFKNLLNALYADQPFYQEIVKERPNFVDELISELTRTIDGMDKQMRPKTASDFANIKLSDPQLDRALYLMLRGAPYKEIGNEAQQAGLDKTLVEDSAEVEPDTQSPADEEQISLDASEHVSPLGYYSLLDYITLASEPNVRIFLAPKEVLQSIFLDPSTVSAVLDERYRLYRQADNGADVKELGLKFKTEFERMKDPLIHSSSLNFEVSKTRPKREG